MNDQTRTPPDADAGNGLAFGEFAEDYEETRPGYPSALFDDLLDFAEITPDARILEIGSGTGKATTPLAQRDLALTCLEPSAEMARVLSRRCGRYPKVEIRVVEFEQWAPDGGYDLVLAAQSWHWMDPATRLAKAAGALRPGRTIALCWNGPPQPRTAIAEEFRHILLRHQQMRETGSPTLTAPPQHPRLWDSPLFGEVTTRTYWSALTLTPTAYLQLLRSYPACRGIEEHVFRQLRTELTEFAQSRNGLLPLCYATVLHLARRTGVTL